MINSFNSLPFNLNLGSLQSSLSSILSSFFFFFFLSRQQQQQNKHFQHFKQRFLHFLLKQQQILSVVLLQQLQHLIEQLMQACVVLIGQLHKQSLNALQQSPVRVQQLQRQSFVFLHMFTMHEPMHLGKVQKTAVHDFFIHQHIALALLLQHF